MKNLYSCPYCNQQSTRRWNLDVHIKRRHGGYLPGRPPGRYMDSNLPLYGKSVQFGRASVADSVENTFQPKYIPQQAPVGISQDYTRRPMQTMGDQQAKLEELKVLLAKYTSPAQGFAFFQRAKSQLEEGHDRFLNDTLNHLRMRDLTAPVGMKAPFLL